MEDYKKHLALFFIIVLALSMPLIFSNKRNTKTTKNTNKVEEELYIDQIYFKNIQVLDELPIDQSLLIQDKVSYFFSDNKEEVDKVEIIQGSLEHLGGSEDFKYTFKIKYKHGILEVYADKDRVDIEKIYEK